MPDLHNSLEQRGAIAWMTRHSVAPNLLMLFMLLGGLFMALRIKQEVFPEFDLDMVMVTVPYPGASPEEVEQGIILAIEEGIRGITGVKEVTAVAREGSGMVTAELEENTDAQRVYQEIRQEVDRITTFPEDAEEPDVVLMTHRREVMDVILYGDADEWILRELAEQVRDRLLQDPNVTQVDLEPARTFEVSIEVPQENLRAYNLTLQAIAERIRSASIELPGGSLRTDSGEILLRMKERRDWAREFENIPIITSADGTQLLVRDLATVRDTFEEEYRFVTYNGKTAVNLEVYRVGKQTPIGVSKAVWKKLEEIRPALPPGVYIDVRRDESEIYRQRLDLLLRNGAMGLALVLVFLTIFLEYKLAFWVAMGIPISFLGSFLLLPAMDVTINMISMFAFIIALGIVVDDAIVVGENVFDYRQSGMGRLEAAIRGAKEVGVPVTFSILTNIAAFAPLAFMPGTMGKIWRVIPLVVSSVFTISLLESMFVLPSHLAHTKKENATSLGQVIHRAQDRVSKLISRMIEKGFGPLLAAVLRFRYLTVSLGAGILVLALGYVASGRMGFEMMPKVEADEADATAILPYGSPLSKLQEVSDRLVRSAQSVAGENGGERLMRGVRAYIRENEIFVTAYLLAPEIRPISTAEFARLWREKTGVIEGLQSLRFESDRRGPGSGASMTVELAHRDIEVLDRASEELAASLAHFANVRDIDDGYTPGKQQLNFRMLPEGRSLGLTAAAVARQLRGAFYGAEAIRQQRGRNEVKVMVRLPKAQRISGFDVESFIVRTPAGADVPLHQVATVQAGRAYTAINRRDGRRTVSVTANVVPQSETDRVLEMLTETTLPDLMSKYPGLTYSFEGRQQDMRESLASLQSGFVIALMLVYVLLGIPFRSYLQPAIVMISIPFGIVGALLGHMIMGYSLSVISMMGLVALSGVVVNDALVLVEYANRQRTKGLSAHEAILSAGVRRFRPIILTTVTTFGGLAPMIFETSRQARFMIPMALSLGYGILFATAITLLIIPCLYLILNDAQRLIGWSTPASDEESTQKLPEIALQRADASR
ncbi:MAG TPA: efflux RND transporter permease subunit [Phycisphaerae bacterium]|mgnify:CR=1 FL=1|nr:efflux RND transporter permease subunit [Phycisphaerae bacterium]